MEHLEIRKEEDKMRISGYAAVFNVARRPGRSTPIRYHLSPHNTRKANDGIGFG